MATLISRIKSNAAGRNKSAAMTLALVGESIAHMEAQGDWTPLAWIVALAEGADVSRLKRIIEAACGVTFKSDKKQPTGLRAVRHDVVDGSNNAKANALAWHIARGTSFRSKALEQAVDGECVALLAAKESEFDLLARVRALYAAAEKAGFTDEQVRLAEVTVRKERLAAFKAA